MYLVPLKVRCGITGNCDCPEPFLGPELGSSKRAASALSHCGVLKRSAVGHVLQDWRRELRKELWTALGAQPSAREEAIRDVF